MESTPDPSVSPGEQHVVRRDDRGRYELTRDDEVLSFAVFSQTGSVVTVPHIETKVQHRNNGYSSDLMAGVVDDLRAKRLLIEPLCPVARAYVETLPDADALMVD
jgi:uncharacterized protein